mgnify:CR=1 FL=1
MSTQQVEVRNVEHIRICGGKNVVCHWPRQVGIWYFGDNEILLGHIHAPCKYEDVAEVAHGQHGMFSRAVVRLQRSQDLGCTWPEEDSQTIFDYKLPREEQRSLLHLDDYTSDYGPRREFMDLSQPDAIMAFGRAFIGKKWVCDGHIFYNEVVWGFRSPDRGHTWEKVPSIVRPNHTDVVIEVGNCYLKRSDGTILGWFVGANRQKNSGKETSCYPQMYMSIDNGVSWHYVSDIWYDPYRRISSSYPYIIELPSGRLLCTLGIWMYRFRNDVRWISLSYSDDGGLSWSEPKRINRWGVSPYGLLLKDGRIVIIYARRHTNAYGMFCIVSEDSGLTWSDEIILRKDPMPSMGVFDGIIQSRKVVDGGYPVAVQLRDNRIFIAYYYQLEEKDVPWPGGRKFIAGTFFDLK